MSPDTRRYIICRSMFGKLVSNEVNFQNLHVEFSQFSTNRGYVSSWNYLSDEAVRAAMTWAETAAIGDSHTVWSTDDKIWAVVVRIKDYVVAPSMPDRIFVFGSFDRPGHRLRTEEGNVIGPAHYDIEKACDWIPNQNWSWTWGDQTEGELHETQPPEGWSIVAWWDRQGDDRGSSHTAIAAEGSWTDQQLIDAARLRTPWAIRVPLKR